MDEKKETKPAEATPEQAGAFMAELLRTLGDQAERQNKFDVAYANNFNFEPSVWDLRIIFGQLEQHSGASAVDWHTAITIPWLQVKLVAYFLRLHAAWNDVQNGPIKIPAHVLPNQLPPLTEEDAKDPSKVAWDKTVKRIYAETLGDNL